MLDTNICIFAMKAHEGVVQTLLGLSPSQVHLSVMTEAELRFGAAKSTRPAANLVALEHFLAPLQIVEFGSDDALVYADVRAALAKAGTPIGPIDTFIAAHALAQGFTLVTNNTREFSRVSGLQLDDWTVRA